MLTESEITEYQSIHKKLFHQEITQEVAREQGIKLIVFLENIFRPRI